ncbi:glycerophosphodiester phosphodiesterase [Asticcacaulis sp. AND118]|uniref:glycerophosphodiester phosphodiesterase n=1 Tax=Asticcacaulis sp. AND118 TaxID=2840468 RepID=UPI001CFF7C97|nr:glycerophosphodiester phosphodiesterase [Asticcacaulis sp. AND118]UDF02546.1 glycerophosphodiester phosphodiesterase [Asticcacaulis sp. AND118]
MSFSVDTARRRFTFGAIACTGAVAGGVIGLRPSLAGTAPVNHKIPLIVAHRGASGYRPEHTIEAYNLAIHMGADYIEPDVVSTRDGVLICRHEPMLSGTTDVRQRPEFASRQRTIAVDGLSITDFFTSDFTLAEIKTLRAKQAFADRDQSYNGRFEVPTLEEVIGLVRNHFKTTGKSVGLYIETKHPTLHRAAGLPLEERLVEVLTKAGMNKAGAPVFLQCFEADGLKRLKALSPLPRVQLVDGGEVDYATGEVGASVPFDWAAAGRKGVYADMLTPEGLAEVRTYADVIAPWKRYLLKAVANGPVTDKTSEADCRIVENRALIEAAHKAGLKVHTWTLRNDATRLASVYKGDPQAEFKQLFDMGIDGVFTDFADTGVAARKAFLG